MPRNETPKKDFSLEYTRVSEGTPLRMQGAIVRVCVVVAAAILNHPLLFPKENGTVPERDEELLARMREHEELLQAERRRLELEMEQEPEPEPEPAAPHEQKEESSYGWYFWSALSLVVFLAIEICRQELAERGTCDPAHEDEEAALVLPDKGLLDGFYESQVRVPAKDSWGVREFVEGFADDLLEALRSVCDREADMEVEDCVGVGSMYESWRAGKPLVCDLIVPFAPPEPYSFRFQLWCSPGSEIPPDMQGCGRIQVVRAGDDQTDCLCGTADLGEDMLCLLHCKNERPQAEGAVGDLLCSKGTPYLAKDQVMKWFQSSITRAWGRISHKYDFAVTFRHLDSPGALKVRLQSGKVVVLNITPVVQLEDTDAYFISHFAPESQGGSPSDTCWPLSFAVYEKNLLKSLAKSLPENPCHLQCLQIACFLHTKQTGLTGGSALTSYHLKTVLLHLLLGKLASDWGPGCLGDRLRDLLGLLERSLQEKRLCHALIGNPLLPRELGIPPVFLVSEPVNLFRHLVLERRLYARTVEHLREMVRNAPVLIQEYTPQFPNGNLHQTISLQP